MAEPRRKPALSRIARGLLLASGTLVVLEGLASLALYAYDLAFNTRSGSSEREVEYTQFDPEIGWVSRPGVRVEDLFGPGLDLATNAAGARGSQVLAREVPPGKLRVVCVGDSFTQGYGVADDQTWPHALGALDSRLEVVNLGQRGYGIDQAWLWYLRKAAELEHDLVVLAFIADDWRRVRLARYQGYPKPLLVRGAEQPLIANAPLSPPRWRWGFWHLNLELLMSPRAVQLVERVRLKLGGPAASDPTVMSEREAADVVAQLFEALDRHCRAAGRRLVLLYLPSRVAGMAGGSVPLGGEPLRICEAARERGIALVDLSGDFAQLPVTQRDALFIDLVETVYPWAQNHYNAEGNRFVAVALHRRLCELGLLAAQAAAPR